MRKKGIAVVLSLAMIVSVVTGCGKEKEEVTTQEIVTEAESQEIVTEAMTEKENEEAKELEIQTAITAYQEFINEHDGEYMQAGLAYLFDSDIPVLFLNKGIEAFNGMFMFIYDNGEVRELGNDGSDSYSGYGHYGTVGLIEKQGIIIVSNINQGYNTSYYSRVDNSGEVSLIHGFYIENYDSLEDNQKYFMDDVEISKEKWESEISKMDSMGNVTYPIVDEKYNLSSIYDKLNGNVSEEVASEQIDDIYPDDLDQYSLREANTFLEKVIFGGTDFDDLQTYFDSLPKHDFENGYPTSFSISSDRAELSCYDIMGCRTDYTIYATNPLEYKDDSGKIIHTAKSRIEMLENDGESLGVYSTFEKMLRNQDVSYKSEKIEGSAYVTFMEVGINLSDSHDVSLEDSDEVFIQKSSDYQTVTTDDLRSYFESITLEDYKKYTSIKREGNIDGLSRDCYSFVIDEIPWDEYTGVEGDAILIVIDIPDYCFDFAPEELEGLGIDFGVSIYSKTDYLSGVEEE